MAKSARIAGAEVYLNTKVEDLVHKSDGSWTVVTDKGNIHCEHVVNCAGLWAREVGQMAGVHVPIIPMEHHYILTGDIDEIKDFDSELPMMIDLDGEMYLRQEQNGVLLGVYEKNSTPWSVDGTPWGYGETDLLEPRMDDIGDALMQGFERFPSLAEAGIRRIVNGARARHAGRLRCPRKHAGLHPRPRSPVLRGHEGGRAVRHSGLASGKVRARRPPREVR